MSVESAELLRKENTEKIIDAMKNLLNENNSTDLTLARIARRAGVSVKTINNIFGSKNILMLMTAISAYTDGIEMLKQLSAEAVFAQKSGLEQVMTLHCERAKFQRRNPYIIRVIAEIERLKLTNEAEIELCNQYLVLANSITSYYDEPIQKGHLDGSIKQNIREEEIHAILFFAFGAITQKLQMISFNELMNKQINPYATLRIVLKKTKDYIGT